MRLWVIHIIYTKKIPSKHSCLLGVTPSSLNVVTFQAPDPWPCVFVCVGACVCGRLCMRALVRVCICACMCACVRVRERIWKKPYVSRSVCQHVHAHVHVGLCLSECLCLYLRRVKSAWKRVTRLWVEIHLLLWTFPHLDVGSLRLYLHVAVWWLVRQLAVWYVPLLECKYGQERHGKTHAWSQGLNVLP